MDFNFIADIPLRNKIIDAIEMVSILYLNVENGKFSALVIKELRRMIILYNASIIEALLLHLYVRGEHTILKTDYKNIQMLSPAFQLEHGVDFVIAKRVKIQKDDRELMLDALLKYFHETGTMTDQLKEQIDRTRNIRNTFHLSKPRKNILCGKSTVELSNSTVVEIVDLIRSNLQ